MNVVRGLATLLLVAGTARPLAAQGSTFGIQGLGMPGRPVSGHDAALGGALGAIDPTGTANPAALGRFTGLAGWGVGAPAYRSFEGTGAVQTFRATRFPLFGFASNIRRRLAVGLSAGDFLDRNWSVTESDTIVIRADTVPFDDAAQSLGGVSDLRLAAAYRASPRVSVGLAIHALSGSTRLTVRRNFDSNAYTDVSDVSTTDFGGLGVSAGILASPAPRLDVGASIKLAGHLTAENSAGLSARVALPLEATVSAAYEVVPGVALAGSAHHAGWSRASDDLVAAGQAPTRDLWAVAVGLDVDRANLLLARLPLRLGYRRTQLPLQVGGAWLSERAVSGGIGLRFAGGRTTADLAVESGSREAGALRESFQTVFIGITVRP